MAALEFVDDSCLFVPISGGLRKPLVISVEVVDITNALDTVDLGTVNVSISLHAEVLNPRGDQVAIDAAAEQPAAKPVAPITRPATAESIVADPGAKIVVEPFKFKQPIVGDNGTSMDPLPPAGIFREHSAFLKKTFCEMVDKLSLPPEMLRQQRADEIVAACDRVALGAMIASGGKE